MNIKGNRYLLLGKTKKKEPYELRNSWAKMLLNRTNSYIFARCAVNNIVLILLKYFQTYITCIYISVSDVESSFRTPYACLVFQQKDIQNPIKHPRWSIFSEPTLSCYLFAQKHSILDAWRGSEYACVQIASNNIFCRHDKRMMGYFEFLYGSGIICLPLNISEKLHWQHLFENHRLYLS